MPIGEVGGVTRPGALGPRPGIAGGEQPPTVDAGGPYVGTIAVGTLLAATVTPGTDPAPTNKWTIQSGGTGTFDDDTLEDPTFTPDNNGTYVLLLTVSSTDSADVTDTATFKVGAIKQRGLLKRVGRMIH